MIAPTPFFADRGCHVQIYEQMRSLQKLGNKVYLCTYHIGKDIPGFDIRRIPNFPWYKKLEAGPSLHKIYLDFFLLIKSFVTACQVRPDIIHGHLHEGAAIGYVVSRTLGIPLLFDLQGSLTGELKAHNFLSQRGLSLRIFYQAEKIIDGLADIVVTQSTDMVEELRHKFGIKDVYLTLDGVNTDDFHPGIDSSSLKKELGISEDKKIVVYLGILSEYQGVDCLLNAIPKVLSRRKDVYFLIMGYPGVERYKKMAEKLGVLTNCRFLGRIDYAKAPEYLNLGNIAVGPKLGLTEADGKIYNYMACGLPIVASDTPVHREILADTALYARPADATALAEALLQMLDNTTLARELGLRGRQRVVEKFSWDNVAKRLMSYYQKLISKNTG